jgi:CDP-glycerol glycerophosphotransferase
MTMLRKLWRRLKRFLKALINAIGRRVPVVRRWSRRLFAWRRGQIYRSLCRKNALQPDLVIFECYAGRGYTCSPRAIYQAMLADERFADFEFVWAFRGTLSRALRRQLELPEAGAEFVESPVADALDLERVMGEEAIAELAHARLVRYGTRDYYEAHARAKYWVGNYILPTHMIPREGQYYLQTWHGTPLKRLGCDLGAGITNATFEVDEIHARYTNEGNRLSYLISPSPFATEKLSTAFDLNRPEVSGKVLEVGYPRNDFLHEASATDVARIKRRLGVPVDKKVLLYCPTFRDDQHAARVGYVYEAQVDFDRLQAELGEEYLILFRAHYLVASEFDFKRYRGFVIDVSDINDINDLYVVSDLLITDYSSVFFDFTNLGRPIVFYMYDLERYAEDLRGFYLDLVELPGPIVRDETSLIAALKELSAPSSEQRARLREFSERFNPLDDGRAADRTIGRLFLGEGAEESAGSSRNDRLAG